MTSARHIVFKFLDRGEGATIVLIPGWASDYRIFEDMNIRFNYLIPCEGSPDAFEEELLSAMEEYRLDKVSLLGWSLGGFLACEFSAKNSLCVDELILVSIRKRYVTKELDEIKNLLREKKKGYLYKFYSQCFYDNERRDYFRKKFVKKYCEEMELESLIDGLDFLAKSEINIQELDKIKSIKIIHGEFDNIAPLKEARVVADSLPQAEFIVVPDAGHIPFLKKDFAEYIK